MPSSANVIAAKFHNNSIQSLSNNTTGQQSKLSTIQKPIESNVQKIVTPPVAVNRTNAIGFTFGGKFYSVSPRDRNLILGIAILFFFLTKLFMVFFVCK